MFTSPKAGSGAGRDQLPRLFRLLEERRIHFFETSQLDELVEAGRQGELRGEIPTVVTAGGDGTLSLAASSLPKGFPLLPMPMGTENLLARLIGQTNRADDIVKTIESGNQIEIDAGEANGRMFLIMATIGFDAEVVRAVHLRRQGHISRLSYAMPALRLFSRYRYPELQIADESTASGQATRHTAAWAMLFNLPCYAAGLRIMSETDASDGKLDAVLFGRGSPVSTLRYLAAVGIQQHRHLRDVKNAQFEAVRIDCEKRVAYQLDGDYVGKTPVEIRTLPKRVTLLCPKSLPRNLVASIGLSHDAVG
ncbi:MAG: diacylglycerol kinase family protein [Planctomycetota bacterium]